VVEVTLMLAGNWNSLHGSPGRRSLQSALGAPAYCNNPLYSEAQPSNEVDSPTNHCMNVSLKWPMTIKDPWRNRPQHQHRTCTTMGPACLERPIKHSTHLNSFRHSPITSPPDTVWHCVQSCRLSLCFVSPSLA